MNTSIGLGNGYSLDAVRTTFVLQALICSLAFDDEGNIFDIPLSRLIDIQDFDFPTFTLRVACVHAKEFSSEKRCLVSTFSALDANNGIFILLHICIEEQYLHLPETVFS